MNYLRFKIMVLLFLFTCFGISAVDNNKDTLIINFDSAWEMMKDNNLEFQRLMIDEEILIREADNKKYWIPGISAGASLSRNSPFISWITNSDNATLSEADNWSLRGAIDIRLNIYFNISLEDQKEALELSILMLQRQSRMRDLRANLQKLYYQIITGLNTIELQEKNLTLAQKRLEQIQTQYNQGLRSDLELLTAKIAAAKDLPALLKAQVEQKKRLITFRDYIGFDDITSFTLAPDLDLNPPFDGKNLQVINNESLQIDELELKLAEINKELSVKNLYTPSLNLNLGWSSSIKPIFEQDSWTADEWNDGIGLGLSFSVPLDTHITGTEGQLNLKRQDDNIDKMKLSIEESREQINKEFQYLMLDLELSRANIEVSELNVTLQEQIFRKVQDDFDSGRSSLLDLNDSRQELRAAKLSLENERLNQRLIRIDLEQIAGVF